MKGTQYLALYTGPMGPISAIFEADSLEDAQELARTSSWYDDARTDLELGPAAAEPIPATGRVSSKLERAIERATQLGGWTLLIRAGSDSDYAFYARPTLPERERLVEIAGRLAPRDFLGFVAAVAELSPVLGAFLRRYTEDADEETHELASWPAMALEDWAMLAGHGVLDESRAETLYDEIYRQDDDHDAT